MEANHSLTITGFNPRPPLLAGDPGAARPWGCCCRCFNPRPPLLAGDPWRCAGQGHRHRRFNPRPPLLAGDPSSTQAYSVTLTFQSAPAIAGGRSPPCRCSMAKPWVFQSAPAIAGGRSLRGMARWHRAGVVSIRARHCWRAIRSCSC